jgi:hypothetical protein
MPEEQSNQSQGSPFEIITTSKPKTISPKNVFITAVVILFLSVSVFLGTYLVQQRQNATNKAAPESTIYISPDTQSQAPGSNFTFSVNMDTATNAVTGVDVRLIYNPGVMQVVSLSKGAGVANLDQTINNTYDNSTGKISFAIFTIDRTKAVTGSGVEVLKVNARVLPDAVAGSSDITFDPATAASATQEGANVLVGNTKGTLVVTGAVTPSPTPTPGGISAPTNLTPSGNINPGSVAITWSAVSGATGYLLRVDDTTNGANGACDVNQGPNDVCQALSTNSFNYNFEAGRKYHIWVHTYVTNVSNFSAAVSSDVVVSGVLVSPTATPTALPTATATATALPACSDFVSGTMSSTTLQSGQQVTLSCDFGRTDLNCTAPGPVEERPFVGCAFTSYNGNKAVFTCNAPSQPGSYTFYCSHFTTPACTTLGIVACKNQVQSFTVVAASSPTSTPTATPTSAPVAGALNSCGGTCGSNSNCQANYICSNGYCRNPSCTDSQNCVCNPNPNGNSVSPTATARANANANVNINATARPIPVTGTDWSTYLGIGLGAFAIIGAIVLAL